MSKLSISFGFCALVCLMAWVDAELCLCFLISVTVHECGHLAAAAACRVPVETVKFRASGAVIRTAATGYGQEAVILAAGPAASLFLAGLMMRIWPSVSVIAALHGTVNLLPLRRLDGGRLLRLLMMQKVQPERAETISNWLSAGTACTLMVLASWLIIRLQTGIWPIFASLTMLLRSADP